MMTENGLYDIRLYFYKINITIFSVQSSVLKVEVVMLSDFLLWDIVVRSNS